jgi:8-oxo-dGTP pyrophosphatase MutT (NUDIX family)
VFLLEELAQGLYKFELMTTSHELNFPAFDTAWSWSGASVLLRTDTHLILIKRSLTMPTHAGQMAFFGGHRKLTEIHPFEVAQREYTEESGLSADTIRCLGLLKPVNTARLQPIVPVVADLLIPLDEFMSTAVSNGEWSDLMAVPWSEINHPDRWSWGLFNGHKPHNVFMTPITAGRYLDQRNNNSVTHILWGAIARMVWDYLALYYRPRPSF